MSTIISKNKFSLLSDNGTTAASNMNTTTTDTRQPDTVYPQLSSNNSDNNNPNSNISSIDNSDNSEDDGEWVVKAPIKRQSRQQPRLQHNSNENESEGWNSIIEEEYNDDYMSYTEHELFKHVKATQLKNIRTHPGVPMALRRKH
ncbi:hypothetical protein EC991_007222 [Linnemannia zychae]|nr:hypothetical protein EC991_007222 [Linnemannia zychae]